MPSESIYLRSSGPFLYDMAAKRFYAVADGFVVGRSAGDLTFPDDGRMSRQHMRISLAGAGVRVAHIEDLKSTNGVMVNGIKISAGNKVPIGDGGFIEFGDRIFYFTYTQDVPPFTIEDVPDEEAVAAQAALEKSGAAPKPEVASRSLTKKVVRPDRIRPLNIHPADFLRTDIPDAKAINVVDLSVSGLGLIRDATIAWPMCGSRFTGLIRCGINTQNIVLEILRKTPLVVGCAYHGNTQEIRKFIERNFNIELAASQMKEKADHKPATAVKDRVERLFTGEHCELRYAVELGKILDWSLTFFGNRIEVGSDQKVRLSSDLSVGMMAEKQMGGIVANALRLVGNIENVDEDARDAISARLLAHLGR